MGKKTGDRPEYKGRPLTYARLRQLALDRDHNPEELLTVTKACKSIKQGGLSLYQPIRLMADARGISTDEVLRRAGIKTYSSDLEQRISDRVLRSQIREYAQKAKGPIKIRNLINDKKNGGATLAASLQTLDRKLGGPGTASTQWLRLGGSKIKGLKWSFERCLKGIRKHYPAKAIDGSYRGKCAKKIATLRKQDPVLYQQLSKKNYMLRALKQIDPRKKSEGRRNDFYRHIESKIGNSLPADPENVLDQLIWRLSTGHAINPGLRLSRKRADTEFARDVLSLRKLDEFKDCRTYAQILQKLYPRLRENEILVNDPNKLQLIGYIANLFVHMLLKWTCTLDNTGSFYSNGFKRKFGTPIRWFAAEKRTVSENGKYTIPDFFVIGKKRNTGIEVKTGGTPSQVDLAAKQCNGNGRVFFYEDEKYTLDTHVAIFLMQKNITKDARKKLNGTPVVDAPLFRTYLLDLIKKIESSPEYYSAFAKASPRLHNLRSLLVLYDDIVNRPHSVFRKDYMQMLVFGKRCLEDLVKN